jgi:hypothetical protein
MGYNVQIDYSTCIIANEVKHQVYDIWCELNNPRNNHLKSGGSFGGGGKTAHWYSWMSENFDKECKNVEEILDQLGFEYLTMQDGSLKITDYDSKRGDEEIFFKKVAHLLTGIISWQGEDDDQWTWEFNGTPAHLQIG